MKTVYYLGTYRSELIAERKPAGSSAEDYKMQYLIGVLKRLGYRVVVISLLTSPLRGFHPRKVCSVDAQETHVYLEAFTARGRFSGTAAAALSYLILFRYLLSVLRKGDTLLVYHAQLFSLPVRLARALRRFRLILEIEEIFYREARTPKEVAREKTERALLDAADGYLAVNEAVRAEYCGGKPSVLSYGAYTVPPEYAEPPDDGKIHLVYAGIINATHGSHTAVAAMEHLDDRYRLHIYGFGLQRELDALRDMIAAANARFGGERILFHGQKAGRAFDEGLQRCHIGLNFNITLAPESGQYAFPSKIPSYLGHGLDVLTYRIGSVEHSAFQGCVQYFEEQTPEAVARAVESVTPHDRRTQTALIRDLDRTFVARLRRLLEEA